MKPLFEIGQKVVFEMPKNGGNYQENTPPLDNGEIYKVSNNYLPFGNQIFIAVTKYPGYCYDQTCFRPVDDTFGEWVEETVLKEAILEVHQLQNQ